MKNLIYILSLSLALLVGAPVAEASAPAIPKSSTELAFIGGGKKKNNKRYERHKKVRRGKHTCLKQSGCKGKAAARKNAKGKKACKK